MPLVGPRLIVRPVRGLCRGTGPELPSPTLQRKLPPTGTGPISTAGF